MKALTILMFLAAFADDASEKKLKKEREVLQQDRISRIAHELPRIKQPPKESHFPDGFVHLQPKQGSPAWVSNFVKQTESDRLFWIQELEAMSEIERTVAKKSRKSSDRTEANRKIAEHAARINSLVTEDVTWIDCFEYAANLPDSRPLSHELVVSFSQPKRIVQVIGKQRCIIKINEPIVKQFKTARQIEWRETLAIVQGVSTDGRVDDRDYDFGGKFLVSRTETYVTPTGGSKTVFVLEPINPMEYVERK